MLQYALALAVQRCVVDENLNIGEVNRTSMHIVGVSNQSFHLGFSLFACEIGKAIFVCGVCVHSNGFLRHLLVTHECLRFNFLSGCWVWYMLHVE